MKKILLLVLSLFLALPVYGADTKGSALTDGSGSIAGTDYVLGYTTTGPASRRYTVNSVLSLVTPTTLGLVIGTDVQAFNTNLTAINQALTNTSNPAFSTLNLTGAGLTVGTGSTTTGLLQVKNATNNNILTIQPGVTGSNWSITWPTAPPAGNDYLWKISTSGVIEYTDPASFGGGSMTWPSTAGIPYWTSGTAWGGAYNATTKIPANYIPDATNASAGVATAAQITELERVGAALPTAVDGENAVVYTNNTVDPTVSAGTYWGFFYGGLLKTNENGTKYSVVKSPYAGPVSFTGPTAALPDAAATILYSGMSGAVLASPQLVITTSGLTQDNVYYRTSGSAWATADANGSSTYPARCYAISTTQCLIGGSVTKTSHGFTVGASLFLSETAGAVTTTAPTTSGSVVQKIGWVFDANTLIVGIAPDYGTVQ